MTFFSFFIEKINSIIIFGDILFLKKFFKYYNEFYILKKNYFIKMGATNGTIKENKNLLNTYEIMKEIKI